MMSLNSPLGLLNWAKKANFMARMCLEDVEMCSTVILKVISTKTKSIIVTYPVAINTAIYMAIMAVIIQPKPSASLTIRFTDGDGWCAALEVSSKLTNTGKI